MHKSSPSWPLSLLFIAAFSCCRGTAAAQQPEPATQEAPGPTGAAQPVASTDSTEMRVSGAMQMHDGETLLGNGSTVTASSKTVNLSLARGGQLRICATTSVHLTRDRSIDDPQNQALLIALDRGALETSYSVGKYSDVLLTPDLRILISGPGEANLRVRINDAGDTCVDNSGTNAPYVTVSSQLEGGAYRVMPGQRVMFEHGSLKDVDDREPEPCGCPAAPAISVASAGVPSENPARPGQPAGEHVGQPVGGPSSTSADVTFPLAESEGLAPPPPPASKPVVPPGVAAAQVTVPLTYSGDNPTALPPAVQPHPDAVSQASANPQSPAPPTLTPEGAQETAIAQAPPVPPTPAAPQKTPHVGLFHRIGRFFSTFFGV